MSEEFMDILEDPPLPAGEPLAVWRILVVDDDLEVHEATRFALEGVELLGRRLQLSYANSGAAALALLREDHDFAAILLDVVMESQDSGLQLVGIIREELLLDQLRIILRTGQPGYAPELEVFARYDINDYRTKAELNRARLLTSLCAALRAYEQIHVIAENRRGLERIVNASAELLELHALNAFAEGMLEQITALLRLPLDGVVCVQRGLPLAADGAAELFVVGAAGRLANSIAKPLGLLGDETVRQQVALCMQQQQHCFDGPRTCLYLQNGKHEAVVYLAAAMPLQTLERQLLEVFAANLSACFGNVRLVERLEYLAFHDPLTGLHNRAGFLEDIERAGPQPKQAIALLDIAHFADLNDGLGHEFGNRVLCSLADRLRQQLGEQCQLARISADVFGITGAEAQVNPEQLYRMLETPLAVDGMRLPLQAALGLCSLLETEDNPLISLKRANIALTGRRKVCMPAMSTSFQRWRTAPAGVLRLSINCAKTSKPASWRCGISHRSI